MTGFCDGLSLKAHYGRFLTYAFFVPAGPVTHHVACIHQWQSRLSEPRMRQDQQSRIMPWETRYFSTLQGGAKQIKSSGKPRSSTEILYSQHYLSGISRPQSEELAPAVAPDVNVATGSVVDATGSAPQIVVHSHLVESEQNFTRKITCFIQMVGFLRT